MKERLDVLLVNRKLADSREKAKAIIMSGIVYVNGQKEDIYNHKEDICKRIKIRFFLSFALKSWIYKGKKGEK